MTITDLSINTDGTVAYSHSIQRVTGTDILDRPVDVTQRVTDVYRKIQGRWYIVMEHESVPVDLANTGKPDLTSSPDMIWDSKLGHANR
jgi:ketosteroid isomerase-like protein